MVRSWLLARWRMLVPVAVAVVVALVATVALVVPSLTAPGGSSAEEFDCTRLEEASFDEAGPKARACGVEVEVVGERTPWETSWALPNGHSRLEVSSMPSRTNSTGEWTDLDTSIEGTPGEGTLVVAAPVYPIELNAGGTAGQGAPLGSIERDGNRIDVWFPTELPIPEVDDTRVVYALAEGVRLIVSVSVDGTGFLPVVELADPAAAARFQALVDGARPAGFPGQPGDLVFSTELSEGLRLVPEDQGSVLVVDETDEVHFLASPPVMWDSAGGNTDLPESVTEVSEADRTRSPAAGDSIELMETSVDGTRIVVSPDPGMLASAETVWPIYIDPGFNGKPSTENVAIRTGGYTGTLYNWTTVGGEGAGYCTHLATCNTTFKQRLVWEYSGLSTITSLAGSNIISAGFTVYGTHSASCTATTTDLHMLGGISPSTTWGSLEWASYNLVDSRTEYHSVSCGNTGWRTYNAKWAVQQFADNDGWTTLSLGLKARDESTMTGWKRFGHDATLSVEFNRPPYAPSDPTLIEPADRPGCTTGSGRPWINTTTPRMSAIGSDPDGTHVNVRFELANTGSSVLLWDRPAEPWDAASGTRFSSKVDAGILVDGGMYSWRAKTGDWIVHGPYTLWCEFSVDVTRPEKPKVSPVESGVGVAAVYEPDVERGGIGLSGRFTLERGASTDVVNFAYGFNDPLAQKRSAGVDSAGKAVIDFPALNAGPVVLTVKSIDRAGNLSDPTTYSFDVAAPVEDAIWKLDEKGSTSSVDSGPMGAGPLVLAGAGWVDGPHRLFGSRADDWALDFDGEDDAAIGGTVLDTRESFTVSAHVRLDEANQLPGEYVALSQDGLDQSAFRLGYRGDCGGGKACWSFSMPDSSSGSAVTSAMVLLEDLPQVDGEWVHLVGEHNATANTVRVWACPVGTPEQPAIGAPVGSDTVDRSPAAAWQGPGGFVVGRGLTAGSGSNWWPGEIDNVRLFSGEVVDASKLRRLCQGAEAEHFGDGAAAFDAIDPTVRED